MLELEGTVAGVTPLVAPPPGVAVAVCCCCCGGLGAAASFFLHPQKKVRENINIDAIRFMVSTSRVSMLTTPATLRAVADFDQWNIFHRL
jgi:hypothetical protein